MAGLSRRTFSILCITVGASVVCAGCNRLRQYPARPITIVCPWSPGGGTDLVSRQVAVFLEEELGQPVNVVNATGGQGVTGHSKGLHAKPDGYTIAMMTLELNMMHWRHLTKLTYEDSVPLMSLNEDAAALFVLSESPWQTLEELTRAVRQAPGTLKASGTSYLAAWHLALAGYLISQDLNPKDILWITQKGAGPSLQELMSGGLDMVCCSLPEARTLYLQGKLRCLGVMAAERVASPTFHDIPTFREQGVDWQMAGWRGLGLPTGTPAAIRDRLVAALERIVAGQTQVNGTTFPQFMENQEYDHTWRKTDDFRAFMADVDRKFGQILGRDEFRPVSAGPIGPGLFPAVIATLLCGLVVWDTILVRKHRRQIGPASGPSEASGGSAGLAAVHDQPIAGQGPANASGEPPAAASTLYFWNACSDGNLWFIIVAIGAYFFLVDWLGFVLTAAALLFALFWKFGNRPLVSLALAVVLSPAVYWLFSGPLRVTLPYGLLGG